jgi:hypothetical protein
LDRQPSSSELRVAQSAPSSSRGNPARVAKLAGVALSIAMLGGLGYYVSGRTSQGSDSPVQSQTSAPSPAAFAALPTVEPAKSDSASGWLDDVETEMRASVASAGQDCFSGPVEPAPAAAVTLRQFRSTVVAGKLCGARLLVTNRTPQTILVGVSLQTDGETAGWQSVRARQSTYLVLGPSHREALIIVRSSTRDDAAGFSAPLFSGVN